MARGLTATAAVGGILIGLSLLAVGLTAQRARADEPINVPTHAEVVGALRITIDIKPGSYPNAASLPCRGVIPVAILTTSEFDASTVDASTVIFARATPTHSALKDVDRDRDIDLLLHFTCQKARIPTYATEACLQGRTYQGASFEGCDSVRIEPACGSRCGRRSATTASGDSAGATAGASPAVGLAEAADVARPTTTAPAGNGDGAPATPTPALAGSDGLWVLMAAAGPRDPPPVSERLLLPPVGGHGDLSTESRPWLLLLVGASVALTLLVSLIAYVRPRRR
jgi:hypothetical protein